MHSLKVNRKNQLRDSRFFSKKNKNDKKVTIFNIKLFTVIMFKLIVLLWYYIIGDKF